MLSETEQKLDISERKARSLKEQIVSYISEIKSLQEKNLKLEVAVSSEKKQLKELEALGQASHQCAKDEELTKLKSELQFTQKIIASYEEAKRNLKKEELEKMKMSSEVQLQVHSQFCKTFIKGEVCHFLMCFNNVQRQL